MIFPRRIVPSLYDAIFALYHAAGRSPQVAQEAIQMQTIVNLVSAGLGVAWVPESVRQFRRAGVVYRAADAFAASAAGADAAKASPVPSRYARPAWSGQGATIRPWRASWLRARARRDASGVLGMPSSSTSISRISGSRGAGARETRRVPGAAVVSDRAVLVAPSTGSSRLSTGRLLLIWDVVIACSTVVAGPASALVTEGRMRLTNVM